VCTRCRAVICTACCTRVDGLNHCHACLEALRRVSTATLGPNISGAATALLLLGMTWILLTGLFWLFEGKLAP